MSGPTLAHDYSPDRVDGSGLLSDACWDAGLLLTLFNSGVSDAHACGQTAGCLRRTNTARV